MKYLKYFKESKEEYYKKWTDSDEDIPAKIMSKYNMDYICSLFPGIIKSKSFPILSNYKYRYEIRDLYTFLRYIFFIRKPPKINKSGEGFISIYIKNEKCNIDIVELEDEYFYVAFYNKRSSLDVSLMYKCDQLDGVKELLKDMNII